MKKYGEFIQSLKDTRKYIKIRVKCNLFEFSSYITLIQKLIRGETNGKYQ